MEILWNITFEIVYKQRTRRSVIITLEHIERTIHYLINNGGISQPLIIELFCSVLAIYRLKLVVYVRSYYSDEESIFL